MGRSLERALHWVFSSDDERGEAVPISSVAVRAVQGAPRWELSSEQEVRRTPSGTLEIVTTKR